MLNLPPLDMFLQEEAGAAAVRLIAQGNRALPFRTRGQVSIRATVIGGYPVLGSVMNSMAVVFNFQDRSDK